MGFWGFGVGSVNLSGPSHMDGGQGISLPNPRTNDGESPLPGQQRHNGRTQHSLRCRAERRSLAARGAWRSSSAQSSTTQAEGDSLLRPHRSNVWVGWSSKNHAVAGMQAPSLSHCSGAVMTAIRQRPRFGARCCCRCPACIRLYRTISRGSIVPPHYDRRACLCMPAFGSFVI